MSDRLKTNLLLSAIVACGCAVPVCFGILESRPAVWEGEIVIEKIQKRRPRCQGLGPSKDYIPYAELTP